MIEVKESIYTDMCVYREKLSITQSHNLAIYIDIRTPPIGKEF